MRAVRNPLNRRVRGGSMRHAGGSLVLGGGSLAQYTALPASLYGTNGTRPAWEANFHTPVLQSFPTTAAGLEALLGVSGATATSIYTFDGAGTGVTDQLGAHNLSRVAGTGLFQQPAVGLTPSVSRLELNTIGDRWEPASTAAFDLNTASVGFLLVMRTPVWATLSGVINKIDESGTFPGWDLRHNGGALKLRAYDGGTIAEASVTYTADDAWHCIIGVLDKTAGQIRLVTDQGSNTVACALWPAAASLAFQVGASPSVNNATVGTQYAYLAMFSGAAAEALYAGATTALSNFWKHASDPSGKISTFSPSAIPATPWAADQVASWSAASTVKQIPLGYDSALTLGTSRGLVCSSAFTNLLTRSDEIENAAWVKTNCAASAVAADLSNSPRGFREARKLTASANNATADHDFTNTGTTHTVAVWVLKLSGNGAGVLRLRGSTSGTVASQSFTATSAWQLVTVTGALTGLDASGTLRLEVSNNGDVWAVALAQAYQGGDRRLFIRTSGSTASTSALDYRGSFGVNVISQGSIGARGLRRPAQSSQRYVLGLCTTGFSNEKNLRLCATRATGGGAGTYMLKEDGATVLANVGGGAASDNAEVRWEADWDVPNSAQRCYSNGTQDGSATGSDTPTTAHTMVTLGGYAAYGLYHEGLAARVRVYGRPMGGRGA